MKTYEWTCNACNAVNHEVDAECQFCQCEGAECKRDNCSNAGHYTTWFNGDSFASGYLIPPLGLIPSNWVRRQVVRYPLPVHMEAGVRSLPGEIWHADRDPVFPLEDANWRTY